MSIQQRSYSGKADKQAMAALVYAFPTDNLNVADLPYRLSSWAFDAPENIRLWFDAGNHLIAWAILQTPFWTIDYAYSLHVGHHLHREILAWADQRAASIQGSSHGHPAWFVRYVRTSGGDEVAVRNTHVFVDPHEFSFVLAYRVSEAERWEPVIEHILDSIQFPDS